MEGKLAVCTHCGVLSSTFNQCERCKRKLPEDVKSVPDKVPTKGMKENSLSFDVRINRLNLKYLGFFSQFFIKIIRGLPLSSADNCQLFIINYFLNLCHFVISNDLFFVFFIVSFYLLIREGIIFV